MMSYQGHIVSLFCLPSGKADDTPISGSCVHKSMPKLAVDYYGFTLGRLGSGASSTFAPSGYYSQHDMNLVSVREIGFQTSIGGFETHSNIRSRRSNHGDDRNHNFSLFIRHGFRDSPCHISLHAQSRN